MSVEHYTNFGSQVTDNIKTKRLHVQTYYAVESFRMIAWRLYTSKVDNNDGATLLLQYNKQY